MSNRNQLKKKQRPAILSKLHTAAALVTCSLSVAVCSNAADHKRQGSGSPAGQQTEMPKKEA